jgi:hypothetical protein
VFTGGAPNHSRKVSDVTGATREVPKVTVMRVVSTHDDEQSSSPHGALPVNDIVGGDLGGV